MKLKESALWTYGIVFSVLKESLMIEMRVDFLNLKRDKFHEKWKPIFKENDISAFYDDVLDIVSAYTKIQTK